MEKSRGCRGNVVDAVFVARSIGVLSGAVVEVFEAERRVMGGGLYILYVHMYVACIFTM